MVDLIWKIEDDNCIIEVADNGPWVGNSIIDKIWQPFFTTKPTGIGTGLGVFISREIIEVYGGGLTYRNVLPTGACVIITLPPNK